MISIRVRMCGCMVGFYNSSAVNMSTSSYSGFVSALSSSARSIALVSSVYASARIGLMSSMLSFTFVFPYHCFHHFRISSLSCFWVVSESFEPFSTYTVPRPVRPRISMIPRLTSAESSLAAVDLDTPFNFWYSPLVIFLFTFRCITAFTWLMFNPMCFRYFSESMSFLKVITGRAQHIAYTFSSAQ